MCPYLDGDLENGGDHVNVGKCEEEADRWKEGIRFKSFEPSVKVWSGLMEIIVRGHQYLSCGESRWNTLNGVLDSLIELLGCEYGFFGRLVDKEDDTQVIKVLSYTNIAWTSELQGLVQKLRELEFGTTGVGLFAHPLRTGEALVANDPEHHPYYKGLPAGHPALNCLLALPILVGQEAVGVLCLANARKGEWTDEDAKVLMPFASMVGSLMLCFESCMVQEEEEEEEVTSLSSSSSSEEDVVVGFDMTDYFTSAMIHGKLLGSLSDGIMVIDDMWRICSVNDCGVKMLKFDDGKGLIRHFRTLDQILGCYWGIDEDESSSSEEKKKRTDLDVENMLLLARISTSVRFEGSLKTSSSEEVTSLSSDSWSSFCFVDLTVTCFHVHGRLYYTIVFRDVGQEKLFQEKDKLLAFLSHEIRNPVQAIASGTALLREKSVSDPENVLQDVFAATELLLGVVNESIDYIQVGSKQFVAKNETFNLDQVLQMCTRVYTSKCPLNVGIRCDNHLKKLIPLVHTDRSRLCQIVGNLLSNASKFTTEGSIVVTVTAKKKKCNMLCISVKDTGCGIRQEDHAKLFQMFTQLGGDRPKKDLGTGLGLILSRKLARALKGDLKLVSSEPGKGTEFLLELPFTCSFANHNEEMTTTKTITTTTTTTNNLNVLFVDDNMVILTCFKRMAKMMQLKADFASDGLEALNMIVENTARGSLYDVVIMDCCMPNMDGYQTVQTLRNKYNYKGKIIAVTGNSQPKDIEKAKQSGYNDILVKPVLFENLKSVIFS